MCVYVCVCACGCIDYAIVYDSDVFPCFQGKKNDNMVRVCTVCVCDSYGPGIIRSVCSADPSGENGRIRPV